MTHLQGFHDRDSRANSCILKYLRKKLGVLGEVLEVSK